MRIESDTGRRFQFARTGPQTRQVFAFRAEHLDSLVSPVGHVNAAALADRQAFWRIELTVT
jgi:hypothetical protein